MSRQSVGETLASISVEKRVGSMKVLGLHRSMADVPLSTPNPGHGCASQNPLHESPEVVQARRVE